MESFQLYISQESIAMEANKILSSSLLDLVFDARNKDYGAYELRKHYNKRITTALMSAGVIALLSIGGTLWARNSGSNEDARIKTTVVTIEDIKPEEEQKALPPPEKMPEPEPVRTEKLTPPQIVPDEQVKEPPPTQEDLANAKIDVVKQDGVDFNQVAKPSDLDGNTGIIEAKKEPEPEIWTKVEIDAEFPGGIKKWLQFLERNCNGQVASDNGAPAGRHTVVLKFVVDETGTVSNIQPLTKLGYGMEEEAIRVLNKAAKMKWTPAFQNQRYVKAWRTQPITFLVQGDD